MAEDAILRQTSAERAPERVHIVNSFADKRAFFEHVLVHIGDRVGVGVNARITSKEPCVWRLAGAGQTDADTRLQNAIPMGHASAFVIIMRSVQGVSESTDKFPRG